MAGSRRPRPPNRGARKIRRWFHARAVARPRAHRGRRRGQARSASHRRNPGRGPPPASKYSASNHPPKAQALCQAFDTDHEFISPSAKRGGTIKRFGAKGKWHGGEKDEGDGVSTGRVGAGLSPPSLRAPSLRAKRSSPSFGARGDNGLLRFARNDGGYRFAISKRAHYHVRA